MLKLAKCRRCREEGFGETELSYGLCLRCQAELTDSRELSSKKIRAQQSEEERAEERRKAKIKHLLITTETWVGNDIERLGIVATEVVLGMNILRDLLANIRDIVGGRSGAVQKTLDEARETALTELKAKAYDLGADAVIAVDIDYHSISTGSAVNMMMVAVSGTAVRKRQA